MTQSKKQVSKNSRPQKKTSGSKPTQRQQGTRAKQKKKSNIPRMYAVPASTPTVRGSTPKSGPTVFSVDRKVRTVDHLAEKAVRSERRVISDQPRIKVPRNLRYHVSESSGKDAAQESRAVRNIKKILSPDEMLSPDVKRYCALLDKPLTAPWGDEGEIQVKPPLYEDLVPPASTTTCRQFGQTNLSCTGKEEIWIVLCGGAGNQQAFTLDNDLDEGDTTNFAGVTTCPTAQVAGVNVESALCCTFGAPRDNRALVGGQPAESGGEGVAGYWYRAKKGANLPPVVNFYQNIGSAAMEGIHSLEPNFSASNLLQWGSTAAYGDMSPEDSAEYCYRPVASGIQVTPLNTEFSVGGAYDAAVIPQGTNDTYVSIFGTAGAGEGFAAGAQPFLALPDHRIERANGSLELNWLPGEQDYAFLQTTEHLFDAGVGVSGGYKQITGKTTAVNNARAFIRITPPSVPNPDEDGEYTFVASYVSFFEIAGKCIQSSGTIPRPQPDLGSKVSTAVQESLHTEINDRSSQVTKGATFQAACDHPKLGPMVEKASTLDGAKGALDEIVNFGKEILPFASLLL